MNKILKLKIIGIIIAFLLCFPLHFLYGKMPNFITSVIAPVNESIFEHMKLLFTSITISGIIQYIIVKNKKINTNNVLFSNFVSAILSIPIFLVIFLPIYKIIGENLTINIILMLIAIILSQIISYIIMKKDNLKLENNAIILTIIMYILFAILTYFTPNLELFKDPLTNSYGIKK